VPRGIGQCLRPRLPQTAHGRPCPGRHHRHVPQPDRRNGLIGLIGYVLLSAAYLLIACGVYTAAYVFPDFAAANVAHMNDILVVDTGRGSAQGDIGVLGTVVQVRSILYLAGGLPFGIALFRAKVLARWATILLALGGLASILLSQMPDAFYRFLAWPNGIAMIGLGYSL